LLQPVGRGEASRCLANMPKVGVTIIIMVLVIVMMEMMNLNGGDSSGMCE
jgi:hypothetical protein